MRIHQLSLINFRNYEKMSLRLERGLNLFVGENAQGKTNLLEAIYVCALSRSHRTKADAEMIRQGYDTAKIALDFEDKLGGRRMQVEISRQARKRVAVDGKLLARSIEQMGVFNAVMFSPEDLSLVKDGPGERRRFMDMELSQMRPAYCFALQRYSRALKQRNALLKLPEPPSDQLGVWEHQMAEAAAVIASWRVSFTARLNELAGEIHARVCRRKEKLSLEYESCIKERFFTGDGSGAPSETSETAAASAYSEAFLRQIQHSREADIRRGATTFGVHREDLSILINSQSARQFASQGQQRTAALSLKLSEIALVQELTQNKPVVLLDDVLSELDEYRRELLFSAIGGAQVLVTCTGAEGYRPAAAAVFHVREGCVGGV